MNKRKDQIARVDRRVLPKSEIYTTDLWGNRVVKTVWCEHHRRYEDIRLFYMESSAKAKHENEVRSMCIEAWELTNGKIHWQGSERASLIAFFDRNSDD
jgi:hypothetical protein